MMAAGIVLVLWSGWHNLRERGVVRTQQPSHIAPPSGQATDTEASESAESPSPLLGKSAPAFTLLNLDGKKVSLGDFKGRPLLINYWGTYCGPCKVEMPWLEEFNKKYAASGFQVVGITYDSEVGKATIARATRQLGVTYPILLSDAKAEADYLSGTEVLPISFYVDKTGKVIEVVAGQGRKDEIEDKIKETIAAGSK